MNGDSYCDGGDHLFSLILDNFPSPLPAEAMFAPGVFMLSCLVVMMVAMMPLSIIAQERINESALDGRDMIGAYGGSNGSFLSIRSGFLFWLPSGYTVSDPAGYGVEFGALYARQMPGLFVTRPSSPEESVDTQRLYRRITTFELRLLYLQFAGTAGVAGTPGQHSEGVLDFHMSFMTLEPRLIFDLAAMRNASALRLSIGASLGYILEADLAARDGSLPAESATPESEFRSFYGAMTAGLSYRFSLGRQGYGLPAIAPEVNLVIPLTSISDGSSWLPFALRFGVGVSWPL